MSGLLQRLAGQALNSNARAIASKRIRPAAGVQAQLPLGMATDGGPAILTIPQTVTSSIDPDRRLDATPNAGETRGGGDSKGATRDFTPDRAPDAHSPALNPRTATRLEQTAASIAPLPSSSALNIEGRAPQLLLGEEPVAVSPLPAITPMVLRRTQGKAAQARSESEPTEVHVHIGRIEVTARQEPAVPKKARAAPRSSVPLSEYLARGKHP
jgi:hypothetical protein